MATRFGSQFFFLARLQIHTLLQATRYKNPKLNAQLHDILRFFFSWIRFLRSASKPARNRNHQNILSKGIRSGVVLFLIYRTVRRLV
jgi:hypothetical protein